tara:strand:+ start:718 stop:939 length:222 start_codon:yes stop_codon:yes gene_type:complete
MTILFASKGFGYPFNIPLKAIQSLPIDPITMKLLSFLPIIAFFALLIAAVWSQAKKYPVRILNGSSNQNARSF